MGGFDICTKHAQEGMVHVRSKRCGHPSCTKHPSFGVAFSKKPEFCLQHAPEGMVDVHSKRCGHPSCTTRSSYGVAGSKKPEFCSQHAQEGMVDVVNKRCGHPSCTTRPSYGVAGSKKPEFCLQHAQEGMVHVRSKKKCGHPSCTKHPSFGVAFNKKPEFCLQHAPEGMVNVHSKRCGHPSCNIRPSYGVAGSKKPVFCSRHAPEGMVNVRTAVRVSPTGPGLQHEHCCDEDVDDDVHRGETSGRKKKRANFTSARNPLSGRGAGASKRARRPTRSDRGCTQASVAVTPDLVKTETLEGIPRAATESPAKDSPRCPLTLRGTPPLRASPESPPGGAGGVKAEVGV